MHLSHSVSYRKPRIDEGLPTAPRYSYPSMLGAMAYPQQRRGLLTPFPLPLSPASNFPPASLLLPRLGSGAFEVGFVRSYQAGVQCYVSWPPICCGSSFGPTLPFVLLPFYLLSPCIRRGLCGTSFLAVCLPTIITWKPF